MTRWSSKLLANGFHMKRVFLVVGRWSTHFSEMASGLVSVNKTKQTAAMAVETFRLSGQNIENIVVNEGSF